MTPVALRLRELRKAKGMTQSELAGSVGTTQKTISKLESGEKPLVDLDQLVAICMALGVTMADLVPVPKAKRPLK